MSAIRAIRRHSSSQPQSVRDEIWPAGTEPTLREMFADPLVHLVMRRDGVTPEMLAGFIAEGRARLRRDLCWRCAA